MYVFFFKRIIDLIISITGIVLLFPFFGIISIVLFFLNNGKPFFFQLRPGFKGKIFKIIKFKTMNDKKDETGKLLSDDKRLTKIGILLRKTSIDELPQLFNVLIGNMSLVGPRPLLKDYYYLYNDFQKKRHHVKPGITGMVQVNGRNNLEWDKRFELDVWYVDNVSFFLDCKIFLKTILKIIIPEKPISVPKIPIEPFSNYN